MLAFSIVNPGDTQGKVISIPAGLSLAVGLCWPMGTLVLKSTYAAGTGEQFNVAPFVIEVLKVVGSRRGPIDKELVLLDLKDTSPSTNASNHQSLRVTKYITKHFSLSKADEAIKCAAEKSTMKVQIICSEK
jgi:threonine dehydrogenase-like Zn-dependent dehydrogenase